MPYVTRDSAGAIVQVWGEYPQPGAAWEEEAPLEAVSTVFTTREYLEKFTREEHGAARASSSPDVQWMLDRMIAAQFIDVADPETAAGLDLLVQQQILTPIRRDELLKPGAP